MRTILRRAGAPTMRIRGLRPLDHEDLAGLRRWLAERWGAPTIAVHGRLFLPEDLAGFVAEEDAGWIGLATYVLSDASCEIVTIDSASAGRGIGTALVQAIEGIARGRRLWCVTTNDNLPALRFWQRRSFAIVAVHRNAVAAARRLKPEIPLVGIHGIPIRDEIELERRRHVV